MLANNKTLLCLYQQFNGDIVFISAACDCVITTYRVLIPIVTILVCIALKMFFLLLVHLYNLSYKL